MDQLKEIFENLKGSLIIVTLGTLPQDHPAVLIAEGKEDKYWYDPETASLWWAGKELLRSEKLSKFIGTNEKTKIATKLQKKGSGPPPREFIDSQAQKEMMSYYYKKTQEQKKLEEDNEEDYVNSSWADSKGFKKSFHGLNKNISYK